MGKVGGYGAVFSPARFQGLVYFLKAGAVEIANRGGRGTATTMEVGDAVVVQMKAGV